MNILSILDGRHPKRRDPLVKTQGVQDAQVERPWGQDAQVELLGGELA
jgi:hypothetical protein